MFLYLYLLKVGPGEDKTANGIFRTNNFALGGSGLKSNNGLFLEMSRQEAMYILANYLVWGIH